MKLAGGTRHVNKAIVQLNSEALIGRIDEIEPGCKP